MMSVSNYITNISVSEYISKYRDEDKFIVFCKQCDKYNNCWACPPFNFNTSEHILKYENVYIIGTKINLSSAIRSKSKTVDDSRKMGVEIIAKVRKPLDRRLLILEKEIIGSRAFFAGTCHLCDTNTCTRIKGEKCIYPDKIRPSLEAFGFDIGKTTENLLGIELKWSSDGLLPEYLTLVSGLFTNVKIDDVEKYFAEM